MRLEAVRGRLSCGSRPGSPVISRLTPNVQVASRHALFRGPDVSPGFTRSTGQEA